jgi:hypothetical protein
MKLKYLDKFTTIFPNTVGGKIYAAVAENYTNSKYYISGQRRVRKALFSAFDAAWAGVSRDKISALKNV